MSDVEDELVTCLTAATGLAALVDDRVYPVALPQYVTLPAVTYEALHRDWTHAFGDDSGNIHSFVRVTYWDDGFSDALDGAAEVRTALSRYSVSTGTVVEDCFLDNETHLFDEDREAYALAQDFMVHHQE